MTPVGNVIYVNFRDKGRPARTKREESSLTTRIDNIQGSINRIHRLIQELKNPNSDLTSEELDKILDDVYTRR